MTSLVQISNRLLKLSFFALTLFSTGCQEIASELINRKNEEPTALAIKGNHKTWPNFNLE